MKSAPHFITGTNTGVGKTVLAALLARFLRQSGLNVAACKPVCSGNRDDARRLADALGGALSLDEINPWHFRAPLARCWPPAANTGASVSPKWWPMPAGCGGGLTGC